MSDQHIFSLRKIILLILFTLSIISFAQKHDTISVNQTYKLIDSDSSLIIIDCRDSISFKSGHLPRAIHLDVNDVHFVQKLQLFDKNKVYLIYCRTNGRSGRFVEEMLSQGFKQIYWFEDGFLKWLESNYPIEI